MSVRDKHYSLTNFALTPRPFDFTSRHFSKWKMFSLVGAGYSPFPHTGAASCAPTNPNRTGVFIRCQPYPLLNRIQERI
jgi:hypothetical protein